MPLVEQRLPEYLCVLPVFSSFRVSCLFCSFTCLQVFSSSLWCSPRFQRKIIFDSFLPKFVLQEVYALFFISIYLHILVSNIISIPGIRWCSFCLAVKRRVYEGEQELFILPGLWISCLSMFMFLCSVLQIIVCLLALFYWPLYCHLWLLIIHLVSSNLAYCRHHSLVNRYGMTKDMFGLSWLQSHPQFIFQSLLPDN